MRVQVGTVCGRPSQHSIEGIFDMSIRFPAIAALALSLSTPAMAQDLPVKWGDYWEVSMITVDDGATATYLDHLAGLWRKSQDFAKSKGWIKEYHVLANANARPGEPDFYLVTIFADMANAVESAKRDKEYEAAMATTMRQQDEQSGVRAKYRKVVGSQLFNEILFK
jgi:hypothetical protein